MIRLVFACCLAGLVPIASADSVETAEESTVVVTASRVEESLNDTLWSTTVLTRADIEARQPASVPELLGDLAGISIVNNGGLGKISTVLMRGGESAHTLLLVDGVRVASATSGPAPFELIPVEQIERIEVVRGPRSTLYGTDAIGGVIQIFTRRARTPGFTLGGMASGGSHDTRDVGVDLQLQGENAWLSASAAAFDTHGFNSCASTAINVGAACFADEPDDDGYRNNSGSLTLGFALNERWTTELRSLIARGNTEYDAPELPKPFTAANETDFIERVFALSLDGRLSETWQTHFLLGRNQDEQDNLRDSDFVSFFDTQRDTAGAQFTGHLGGRWRVLVGADYQKDKIESNEEYERTSRWTRGMFSELHGELGDKWSTLVGARYEDNEQFGAHITESLGTGRRLNDSHRLTATWGTAFHAPSFNDLYFPGFGNANLKPEESRSFELGVEGSEPLTSAPLAWSLHIFQTDVEQLISFDPVKFIPVNIATSRIRGAELQGEWSNASWKIGGQLTRMNPINRDNGNRLPRRPKEAASLEVRRMWPSASLGTVLRYGGARFDNLSNTRRVGGYVALDMMLEQRLGDSLRLQARVANLFAQDYSTAALYPQDGRTYSLTLRYQFTGER